MDCDVLKDLADVDLVARNLEMSLLAEVQMSASGEVESEHLRRVLHPLVERDFYLQSTTSVGSSKTWRREDVQPLLPMEEMSDRQVKMRVWTKKVPVYHVTEGDRLLKYSHRDHVSDDDQLKDAFYSSKLAFARVLATRFHKTAKKHA